METSVANIFIISESYKFNPCHVLKRPAELVPEQDDGLIEPLGHHNEIKVGVDLVNLTSDRCLIVEAGKLKSEVPQHLGPAL